MKKNFQDRYRIRTNLRTACLNNAKEGQSSIEFSLAFMLALLFLVLTCRLFLWFCGNMINRQSDYEISRVPAGSSDDLGNLTFHDARRLDILSTDIFKKAE